MTNQSEVAQMLSQIEAIYVAARHGLIGLAETSRHQIITARTESMSQHHHQLIRLWERRSSS